MAENSKTSIAVELRSAIALASQDANVLQDGPINKSWALNLCGRTYVVRQRLNGLARNNQLFAAERHVYPLLSDTVRVPKLIFVETGRGRKVAVFEYISGTPPNWGEPEIRKDFVETLSAVHSISGKGMGPVNHPRIVTNVSRYLADIYSRELRLFRPFQLLSLGEYSRLSNLARGFDVFEGRQPTLCHGDIHPGNFIAGTDGRLWTIDWEAARFRLPESDFNQMSEKWLAAESADALTRQYCDYNGISFDQFRYGVILFKILWHLRTYNFFVGASGANPVNHVENIYSVRALLEGIS